MPDWNWFFSSLAQSAAAIVGFFGAFIISKIVTNEAEFRRRKARIRDLLDAAENFRDRLRTRYFAWYNKHSLKQSMEDLKDRLDAAKGDFKSPAEYYDAIDFSPFISRQEILRRIEGAIAARRAPREPEPSLGRSLSVLHLTTPDISAALQKERDLIDAVIVDLQHHIRAVRSCLQEAKVHPERSSLIPWSIGAVLLLFYSGVLYPLSVLPSASPPRLSPAALWPPALSLRSGLLAVVALVFTAIMLTFFWINHSLRHSSDDLEPLQKDSSIDTYSPYLAVTVENETVEAEGGDTDDDE